MCGLCGALGGPLHWAAGSAVLDAAAMGTQRAERARLARLLDRVTRQRSVRVATWAGISFVVSAPTGAQEIAETVSEVWAAVDRLSARPLDPLGAEWQSARGSL
ncbi:MAG: hypothetical protein H7322_05945 [Ramlibacter sp.]|nr:hypothetical protein [Ramlibacter sp.]